MNENHKTGPVHKSQNASQRQKTLGHLAFILDYLERGSKAQNTEGQLTLTMDDTSPEQHKCQQLLTWYAQQHEIAKETKRIYILLFQSLVC